MKSKVLWVATLLAMGIFIPPLQSVPLSDNGILPPNTATDHDSPAPTLPEQKTLARNPTTIIKEGNVSQIIEALGLLSGVGVEESASDSNLQPMEIQINYITINMTELLAGGSEYDPDLDADDEEIDDVGMIGTSDEDNYIGLFNEENRNGNNDGQEEDSNNLPINLKELDNMANELGSWALCIKIYEGIINGTTPPLNTDAVKKENIMIDGSKAFRFIGQCKLFFSFVLQTFDTLDGNQQTLKAESLPAVSYDEFLHPTPNPNNAFATEEENVVGLAVAEHPTELHEYVVDGPSSSSSLSYAFHPLTGYNVVAETAGNSGADHAEKISVDDETQKNDSKDDNQKGYRLGLIIVITFFASIILASFLFGVICENIRQGRNAGTKQFRTEDVHGFFLQLQKSHDKEYLAKAKA
ncbi:hypothetical protein Ocin01_08991 [Orchesella cincta]|uniref:Uncharacterized protein n=1 Tax=Orchesella cincta TaxID=48709 RepID=A0A1D2MXB7_ORCCI|nr:hypothetical protein Ocin01_08991 [Orchesella cincta]